MADKIAVYRTLYGIFRITYDDVYITGIIRDNQVDLDKESDCDTKTKLTDLAINEIEEYFLRKRKDFTFPMSPRGTDFQKSVWEALRKIPYGETRTYKEIAIRIGKPTAARAVGMANHKNPIHIAIPCHRVIGSKGDLIGYAGGLEMKRELLELESRNH